MVKIFEPIKIDIKTLYMTITTFINNNSEFLKRKNSFGDLQSTTLFKIVDFSQCDGLSDAVTIHNINTYLITEASF